MFVNFTLFVAGVFVGLGLAVIIGSRCRDVNQTRPHLNGTRLQRRRSPVQIVFEPGRECFHTGLTIRPTDQGGNSLAHIHVRIYADMRKVSAPVSKAKRFSLFGGSGRPLNRGFRRQPSATCLIVR